MMILTKNEVKEVAGGVAKFFEVKYQLATDPNGQKLDLVVFHNTTSIQQQEIYYKALKPILLSILKGGKYIFTKDESVELTPIKKP